MVLVVTLNTNHKIGLQKVNNLTESRNQVRAVYNYKLRLEAWSQLTAVYGNVPESKYFPIVNTHLLDCIDCYVSWRVETPILKCAIMFTKQLFCCFVNRGSVMFSEPLIKFDSAMIFL